MPFTTDSMWTPSTYRAALSVWRANAPKTDSAIMAKPAEVSAPRHRKIASVLKPLLMWRAPPGSSEPLKSNWTIVPDNDNNRPDDFTFESGHDYGYTPDELVSRSSQGVTFAFRREPQVYADGNFSHVVQHLHAFPIEGDFEITRIKVGRGKARGGVTRLGSLRFSNGLQTEPAFFIGPDGKAIKGPTRVPAGGMLGASEKYSGAKGSTSAASPSSTPEDFERLLGSQPFRFIPGKRKKPRRTTGPNPPLPPTSMSIHEAREFAGLEPLMTDMRACLPCGSASISGLLLSMQKIRCAGGGSHVAADAATRLRERSTWDATISGLSAGDKKALELAMSADSFEEIGQAFGHEGDYARKAGKRILIAANDNLQAHAEKLAA